MLKAILDIAQGSSLNKVCFLFSPHIDHGHYHGQVFLDLHYCVVKSFVNNPFVQRGQKVYISLTHCVKMYCVIPILEHNKDFFL